MLTFRAAVLEACRQPVRIATVELDGVGEDQVLVRTLASGICHTDFEVYEGSVPVPLPLVLGHEVCGDVVQVGSNVTTVAVGDRVVGSWNPSCGACFFCVRDQPRQCEWAGAAATDARLPGDAHPHLRADIGPLRVFSLLGGHGEYALMHERSAIRVQPQLSPAQASLIGCTVATGTLGAIRAAAIAPGETAAVVGCGAIGLSAIQGARIAGAAAVIAVDRVEKRLHLARELGATDVVDVADSDPAAAVRRSCGGRGADVVIEAAGSGAAFQVAFEAARPGGRIVLLGKIASDDRVSIRFGSLMGEKQIIRSSYGGARPGRDFAMLAQLAVEGTLRIAPLITDEIELDGFNDALAEIASGASVHTVVRYAAAA